MQQFFRKIMVTRDFENALSKEGLILKMLKNNAFVI